MADVSDEKLMALADGELDAVEAAKLTQQIAGDPVLARRLAVFQATGDDLRRVFDQIEASPVPQRLIDAVLWSAPAGRMRELPVGPPAPGLLERLLALVSPPALGWMPAAAAAALVAVAAVSMFGRPHDEAATGAGDLAALRRTGGPALAALASVLDGARSGQISAIALEGRSIEVRPVLSFRTKDQTFCREYDLTATDLALRGLACLEGAAGWSVVAIEQRSGGSQNLGTAPASGFTARSVDAAARQRITGDALSMEIEQRAMARGWKE